MSSEIKLEEQIPQLESITKRLSSAKEALEINGKCPEEGLTHEEDPYNLGFIYASVCNSLHSATDQLNSILVYIEPGGMREIMEESDIVKHLDSKSPAELERLEENETYKTQVENETGEKLEDDGK